MKTMVRNHLAQPIELHLGARTAVVPPYGDVELEDAEAASQQVQHLNNSGQVTLHPMEQPVQRAGPVPRARAETRKGKKKT